VFDAFQIQQPLKWYLADYELSDPAAGSGSGRIRWMPKPVVAPATL
jgi:hypothetical protein